MKITDKNLGVCELEICVKRSTVDSFVEGGRSDTFSRHLTEIEIDFINENYREEIQEYAWENGSRDHN